MEDRNYRPANQPDIQPDIHLDIQMDCGRFELLISDYLDHEIDRPLRRPFAEHLLACSSCHRLFNEVRAVIEACRQVIRLAPTLHMLEERGVEDRLVEATSAGAMLSCPALDQLIFDYFMKDKLQEEMAEVAGSVLSAGDSHLHGPIQQVAQPFEDHFSLCDSCRRLVDGVRQSLQVAPDTGVSDQLHGRILAATVGGR